METDEAALPVPVACSIADVLARAGEAHAANVAVVVATVLTRRGSTPATPGQKLLLAADGTCMGTIGGGALERSVLQEMLALLGAIADGSLDRVASGPKTLSLNLGAGLGMCCGGGVDVLLEPLEPAFPVFIVGAGHIATALAPLLVRSGFTVTVCDDRDAWSDPTRIPDARMIAASYASGAKDFPRRAPFLVMTHDHTLDQDAIEWALREGFAFVGGVGSRAKIARTRTRLEAKGFEPADIQRVRMPLGVAIGARAPLEIAVSIAAEMIAWRRGVALESGERGARAKLPARTRERVERERD